MKVSIDVKDKRERDAMRLGLEDPSVRAFVVVMGILKGLPSGRARKRVLTYVQDRLEEDADAESSNGGGTENRGA